MPPSQPLTTDRLGHTRHHKARVRWEVQPTTVLEHCRSGEHEGVVAAVSRASERARRPATACASTCSLYSPRAEGSGGGPSLVEERRATSERCTERANNLKRVRRMSVHVCQQRQGEHGTRATQQRHLQLLQMQRLVRSTDDKPAAGAWVGLGESLLTRPCWYTMKLSQYNHKQGGTALRH